MATKSTNSNMHAAKKSKNDEFYTQLTDIEKELKHYKRHFKNKTVLLNCDDPTESKFFQFFAAKFEVLGLKKLISTHYKPDGKRAYKLEITRDENGDGKINHLDTVKTKLTGNGDFRSPECIELMREADIVVTNPPFSLFRELIALLMEHKKKFILVGNKNAITYKETFKLLQSNKMWLGNVSPNEFRTPEGITKKLNGLCRWFTNLSIKKRQDEIILYRKYKGNKESYPKYDNYNAINVDKVADIPMDYKGAMGVPITFMDKYNPEQFEIIGLANDKRTIDTAFVQGKPVYLDDKHKKFVGMVLKENNTLRATYARIIIKRK